MSSTTIRTSQLHVLQSNVHHQENFTWAVRTRVVYKWTLFKLVDGTWHICDSLRVEIETGSGLRVIHGHGDGQQSGGR
ncbi:hypothetical protein MPTK1_6g07200 [Marchantia polymorpha subsp. ruderalis]|uniref:Uncharacterized protein n=2 Tax=Marchantia polymorpha TaxID=3197 RepID=A0AAF6BPF3_MARPO|nr:hypothetical protein MARPO_0053s0034 [Marchantia polymorpha]BBN13887.1 hypothetical protein Mp_6g07200 [Marchantia polymorpha subsp. ruderalis]|eukprot:PTQ38088.1 hypothetical protein MARPO_0053s0034 [Marchantia polymorpha]